MRTRCHLGVWISLLGSVVSTIFTGQVPKTQAKLNAQQPYRSIAVPENIAVILRPLLDLRQESVSQCGIPGTPSKCIDGRAYTEEQARHKKFDQLLEKLIKQQGPLVDESLVVLMCFYVGESGEEVDSVISRGRQMLPYLQKYRDRIPIIPNRVYADSMLQGRVIRTEQFRATMLAINKN